MDEGINNQFAELGVEPSPEVIAKCVELCITYHIDDPIAFVEQCIAFTITKFNSSEPTLHNLKELERQLEKENQVKNIKGSRYASKKSAKPSIIPMECENPGEEVNPLAIYGISSGSGGFGIGSENNDNIENVALEGGLASNTTSQTPETKRTLSRTPARQKDALFSTISFSPIGTPRSHLATPGSGKVVYTFGNPKLISSAQWCSTNQLKIQVHSLLLHDGEPLSGANAKYMFDNLRDKVDIIGDRIFYIGQSLCRSVFGNEEYVLSQVDEHSQDTVKTIGVIFCDSEDRLDASSTLLVGSDEAKCRTVRLNFSKTRSVAIFPGQVVMVSGMNPRGDILMVEEIIAERHLEPPPPPKLTGQLSFVVAAGPYTHDDDLVYEPLNDLMAYCKNNRPDVLILTGPFLEVDHKLITENITLAETFDSYFEKIIAGIVESIGSSTAILIVSSHKDANADSVYPTPPFSLKKNYTNVHLLPDPTIVDLNGITIGITSTDIVDHLINSELAVNAGDKVKRIVNYIFNQGSFYPLNPPAENEMCFDSPLASKYAIIEKIPNILILPSAQKCFIRVVNECLAINPGHLAQSLGGTFARFIITPTETEGENNIYNSVGCQICKV